MPNGSGQDLAVALLKGSLKGALLCFYPFVAMAVYL